MSILRSAKQVEAAQEAIRVRNLEETLAGLAKRHEQGPLGGCRCEWHMRAWKLAPWEGTRIDSLAESNK